MIKLCDPNIKTEYRVEDFEEALCRYLDVDYAVCTNSGTSALHLALLSEWAGRDTIRISPNAFIAAPNAAMYCGIIPEPDTRPDLMVQLFGHIGRRSRIEDRCQALGSAHTEYWEAYTHCYSFNWNKIVTCGSGGVLVTTNRAVYLKAKHLRDQAKTDPIFYIHQGLGYNYRMNALQASMGMAGLAEIEQRIEKKRAIAKYYMDRIPDFNEEPEGCRSNYWLSTCYTGKRDKIAEYMIAHGVEVRAMYAPWSDVVTREHERLLCLPSGLDLTRADQDIVIKTLEEGKKKYGVN